MALIECDPPMILPRAVSMRRLPVAAPESAR
jgi:hypothetical protein